MSHPEVVYFDANSRPYQPLDGGRTSVPHRFLAMEDDEPIGLLILDTNASIDLVYVRPDHRRAGVATALLDAAKKRLGVVGHDARLSPDGLAFMQARRVRWYGSGKRTATTSQVDMDIQGAVQLPYQQHLFLNPYRGD